MLTLYSFLQNVFMFVKTMTVRVTKQVYRHSAVFVSAAAVVTVVALTSSGFGSGGSDFHSQGFGGSYSSKGEDLHADVTVSFEKTTTTRELSTPPW